MVERERSIFTNTLLTSAVEAIVRTRGITQAPQYVETTEAPIKLLTDEISLDTTVNTVTASQDSEFSRTNLASYVKGLGILTEQEFALFAAYFDEIKTSKEYFTKEDLSRYYAEARRPVPTNISMSLHQLAEKGLIMDATGVEAKFPKPYIVSSDGMAFIKEYQPKPDTEKKSAKVRKSRPKIKSSYSDINCNDLNLENYPNVKSLKDFKEKMMILYMVTNEKKGEWFTVADVLCLMTDIFGESVTKAQVEGVFKREKIWFKTENVEGNGKEVKRKLLNKGIEFAQSLQSSVE